MSSLRRILASRANGAQSRGPVTPQGKQRSSRNAVRHGLLARCVLLEEESPESFQDMLTQYLERLAPTDDVEYEMIEEMVSASWRMRRAWALETRMLDNAAAQGAPGSADAGGSDDPLDRMAAAFTSLAATPALPLMHRYETRLHLMYHRSLQNLFLLRALGVPNEPSPISEQLVEVAALSEPAGEAVDESVPPPGEEV